MQARFQFLLFLLALFNISQAQRQPLLFDKITRQNGRSLGPVTGIEKDEHGFLWFATREGLYRYDGYQVHSYKHNPKDSTSIPFNDITFMYKDREDIFWLRHFDQFIPFKNEKRSFKYSAVTDLTFDFNAKLVQDTMGNLWIGPGEKGLVKFNKKSGDLSFFRNYPPLYSPEIMEKIRSGFDSLSFARLEVNKNNKDSILEFHVNEESDFLIYSSAETINGELYDYGQLSSNEDTIFQIDPSKVKHAGGARENAIQLRVLKLKPGKYTLHFHTDGEHSPEEWTGDPPTKIPFYGIGMLKLTPPISNSFKKSIEKKYTPPNALTSNNIKDMIVDRDGTFWLLNDNGLEKYIPGKDEFKSISLPYKKYFGKDFSPDHLVFCRDSRGNFWIGSHKGLVCINLKTSKYSEYQNNEDREPLTSNLITSLFNDKQNRLWVGTDEGINLYYPQKDTFYHYRTTNTNNLYGNQITDFYQDISDNIWVASQQGLNKLTKTRFKHHSLSINHYYDYPVISGKNGNLWYKGEENTILKYIRQNNTIERHILPKQIFPGNSGDKSRDYIIEDMIMDELNNIWFASGNKLIGYSTGKSEIMHEQSIKALIVGDDSLMNTIHHIDYEKDGIMRIFSIKGIYTYIISSGKIIQARLFDHSYQNIEEININFIKSVARDEEGNYWIRTGRGIYLYRTGKNELQLVYEYEPYLQDTHLAGGNIMQGPGGKIWFSISTSLVSINPVDLKIEKFGLKYNREIGISNISPVDKGVWVYTNNGAYFCNPGSEEWEEYTSKTGLADNAINGITTDHKNNTWLTSLKGLTRIKKDHGSLNTYFTSEDPINYHFRDFPRRVESREGELLFFHSKGFLSYYPDSINRHKPPVKITGFHIFGEEQKFDTLIYNKKKISLTYNQNHFSIEFGALDFSDPLKNQYRFQLEGIDKGWISTQAFNRKASYTTVPPGHYTFRVKASNNHDVWNQKGATLNIYIAPPWYRTKLAYALYIMFTIAGIITFIKLRERKLIQEKKILEQKVRERTAQIEDQKEEIAAQRDKIALKNKDIQDSIHYANTIQSAALPPKDLFNRILPEYFILFKPRDIVSGDFYWIKQIKDKTVLVAADCTGHGVPGAFMSMLGIAFLNDIISKMKDIQASVILNQLRTNIIQLLHQQEKDSHSNDGMDLALCVIDKENRKVQFSGANNSLYLIREGNIRQFKADRMPIGQYIKKAPFSQHEFTIYKDDTIYIFSDGYVDQFSEKTGKKFKFRRFKELLSSIHKKPMDVQHDILEKTFEEWKGNTEQIDDILVIGVRF